MTQAEQILNHLQSATLTPLEALGKFGCFRLAARIGELRKDGHNIAMDLVEENGKHFAKYSLDVNS